MAIRNVVTGGYLGSKNLIATLGYGASISFTNIDVRYRVTTESSERHPLATETEARTRVASDPIDTRRRLAPKD